MSAKINLAKMEKEIKKQIAEFNKIANKQEHEIRLGLWSREAKRYEDEPGEVYYYGGSVGEDEFFDELLYAPDVPEGWYPSRFCY